ncbi:MAG: HD domain-containing protein [Solobacterium sp.]|nr:HD domain-containing protein [Solobacterium sp.]
MSIFNEKYLEYVKRMTQVRYLSTPSLDGIPDADGYSERLRDNFITIGKLAAENRAFLQEMFFPMMKEERLLTATQVDELISFGDNLIDADNAENLDLPIMSLLAEKLYDDARRKNDISRLVQRLDAKLDTLYALMIVTIRISSNPEIAERYRKVGHEIGEFFLKLLEKDAFAELPDEDTRSIVLTDARYATVFYEREPADETGSSRELVILDQLLEIYSDPFYRSLTPSFDWAYFKYRVLHYIAMSTDLNNLRGFNAATLAHIEQRTEEYYAYWHSDPEQFGQYDDEQLVSLLLTRNRYLARKVDRKVYISTILALYEGRNENAYDLTSVYDNLLLPSEYISMLDPEHLSEEETETLYQVYQNVIRYIFHMSNGGSLSSVLEYSTTILEQFIEIPSRYDFETMGREYMAALHPPTYIHSLMVAQLSRALTQHAIDQCPQELIGLPGCDTAETVQAKKEEILDFIYHAALCHDFGKLAIIDTVLVYGRNLLDMEFDLIRTHPVMGGNMLKKYPSTRAFADIALGHHKWYDGSAGYPADFSPEDSPFRPLIQIVQIADCLDAATDSVGRSYHKGKTFADVREEFIAGMGTVYAPWVVNLLKEPEVAEHLCTLLDEGRKENYRNTYYLLKQHA